MGSCCCGKYNIQTTKEWENKKKFITKKIKQKKSFEQQDLNYLFLDKTEHNHLNQRNIKNLEYLENKYGSELFYEKFVQEICKFAINLDSNAYSIDILQQDSNNNSQIQITRLQCCQFICLMMLNVLEQSTFKTNKLLNFQNLYENNNDFIYDTELGKMECFFNYILIMADQKNEKLFMNEYITIKRLNLGQQIINFEGQMQTVGIDTQKPIIKMQNSSLVAFTSKNIGKKVLKQDKLDEEIFFSTCPEMLVSLIFVEQLQEKESIIFYNIIKYTNHSGYDNNFQYKSNNENIKKSLEIIAIDSLDYSKNQKSQYQPEVIQREIYKAYCGFQGASLNTITTGNWGCGTFQSDPQLKFLIQWIACSLCNKVMTYCTFGEYKLNNVQQIINILNVQDIYQIIQILNNLQFNSYQSVFDQILQNKQFQLSNIKENNISQDDFNEQSSQYPNSCNFYNQNQISQMNQSKYNNNDIKFINQPNINYNVLNQQYPGLNQDGTFNSLKYNYPQQTYQQSFIENQKQTVLPQNNSFIRIIPQYIEEEVLYRQDQKISLQNNNYQQNKYQ